MVIWLAEKGLEGKQCKNIILKYILQRCKAYSTTCPWMIKSLLSCFFKLFHTSFTFVSVHLFHSFGIRVILNHYFFFFHYNTMIGSAVKQLLVLIIVTMGLFQQLILENEIKKDVKSAYCRKKKSLKFAENLLIKIIFDLVYTKQCVMGITSTTLGWWLIFCQTSALVFLPVMRQSYNFFKQLRNEVWRVEMFIHDTRIRKLIEKSRLWKTKQ